jgi:hypothetical protein
LHNRETHVYVTDKMMTGGQQPAERDIGESAVDAAIAVPNEPEIPRM